PVSALEFRRILIWAGLAMVGSRGSAEEGGGTYSRTPPSQWRQAAAFIHSYPRPRQIRRMAVTEHPVATAPASRPSRARLLLAADLGEKAFILALFALMTWRVIQSVASGGVWLNFLQLAGEALAVILILLRKRATELSLRPADWLLAIGATAAPLLVKPSDGAGWAPAGVCAGLMLTGILFQVIAKLTLRFSFGMAPANRGLKVSGPYRIVRHPIYAAYLVGQAG